jgi:hypothetical protein
MMWIAPIVVAAAFVAGCRPGNQSNSKMRTSSIAAASSIRPSSR